MLFNSYIFILAFLPLCLLGYFLLNKFENKNYAQAFLLAMSLWFYGYFNLYYLIIIIASILINFFLYKGIEKNRGQVAGKALMITGVAANLCILGYFKYTDFFISTVNGVFKTNIPLLHILLPLGISFFTFQQVSFIVDAYRGEVPKYGFIGYASFVAFFPQLIAGPIVTHDELVPQFLDNEKKKFNPDNVAAGLFMFSLGLSKKVLVADTFSDVVSYAYVAPERLNTLSAWIIILSYTLQIYFDFSGYCDMAIGIAKMFNIDIPINFNSPYKASTIAEFWDRWHMTLTRFFTKYLYIPLGGNRKGTFRTYLNVFIVFLASGFWHGAGWTFIVWGILHGLFMLINRAGKKQIDKIPFFLKWPVTFLFINLSWVFFRAPSLPVAFQIIKTAFSFTKGPLDPIIANAFRIKEISDVLSVIDLENHFPNIIMTGFFTVVLGITFFAPNSHTLLKKFKPNVLTLLLTAFLFIWSFLSISGVSEFLYFNF